eukprot:1576083-Amphidinium_carterae.1
MSDNVEGEDNHRCAFGRNMSSILGRSGFDPTISGAHRGSKETDGVTLLSEGQQSSGHADHHGVLHLYAGRKSNHKLSAFLNCPVTHVTPHAVHLPQSAMKAGHWDGSFDFLKVVEKRPLIEPNMMERLLRWQVTAITDDSQMWVANPPSSQQTTLMAEARRLMIMGSSVEDAISKATAQILVAPEPGSVTSPRQPAVRCHLQSCSGQCPRERGHPRFQPWLSPAAQVQPTLYPHEGRPHPPTLSAQASSPKSHTPAAKSQAAPKPMQDIISIHDLGSEDSSWGLWGCHKVYWSNHGPGDRTGT